MSQQQQLFDHPMYPNTGVTINSTRNRQPVTGNSPIIRTLGLYQPYATLMLHGKIETRWVRDGKKPPFPLSQYLIYSTKKYYTSEEFSNIAGKYASDGRKKIENDPSLSVKWMSKNQPLNINKSWAIAVGTLTEVELFRPQQQPMAFVDTGMPSFPVKHVDTKGNLIVLWALIFENVKRIKPFEFTHGKQGVGILKDEDRNKIQPV
jgi:hypothetical protein